MTHSAPIQNPSPARLPLQAGSSEEPGCITWAGLQEHEPALRRHLLPRCTDENDINDIIQESFLRAVRYRRAPMDVGRMRGWLIRISSNVHVDKMRSRSRGPTTGVPQEVWENIGEPEPLESRFSWGGGELVMEHALGCLQEVGSEMREQDRHVLDEYYMQGSKTHQIARRLGVSSSMVKVRLFRARGRLRTLLEKRFRQEGTPAYAWA